MCRCLVLSRPVSFGLVFSCLCLVLSIVFNRPQTEDWSHQGQFCSIRLCLLFPSITDRMQIIESTTLSLHVILGLNWALDPYLRLRPFPLNLHSSDPQQMPEPRKHPMFDQSEQTHFYSSRLQDPLICLSRSPWYREMRWILPPRPFLWSSFHCHNCHRTHIAYLLQAKYCDVSTPFLVLIQHNVPSLVLNESLYHAQSSRYQVNEDMGMCLRAQTGCSAPSCYKRRQFLTIVFVLSTLINTFCWLHACSERFTISCAFRDCQQNNAICNIS